MTANTQNTHSADPRELRRALEMVDFFAGLAEVEIQRAARRTPQGSVLPVLLVGGFLGSGKTTLMQRLLTGNHGLRITAVVNDVAEINIDARLVKRSSNDTLELGNGCVCCSQSGELARMLDEIAAAPDRPDVIMIETSGVADLWALAQIVSRLDTCTLDGVVNVLDAANPPAAEVAELMIRQIAAADIVLLNKTDIATRQQLAEAEAIATRHAPRAQVLRTAECAVPTAALLGPLNIAPRVLEPHSSSGHSHFASTFTTLALRSHKTIDLAKVEHLLDTLPCNVLRAKGLLRVSDAEKTVYELHQVGGRRRTTLAGMTCNSSELVLIGTREAMDLETLMQHFSVAGFELPSQETCVVL